MSPHAAEPYNLFWNELRRIEWSGITQVEMHKRGIERSFRDLIRIDNQFFRIDCQDVKLLLKVIVSFRLLNSLEIVI